MNYVSKNNEGMDLAMWGPWAQDLVGALFLSAEVKKISYV